MNNPTRHKLDEAEFHLRLTREHYQQDTEFSFYLSAFLSAARSVTFYMQKQYGNKSGFADWYCKKQTQMIADDDLKFLNEARVEDVHRRPVRTGASRAASFSLDAILVTSDVKQDLESRANMPNSDIKYPDTTQERFFVNRRNVEAVAFCEAQLLKLQELVERCENKYPNN